ncbi:MAG: transporter [Tetrasphaera sp.]|nr:transporter [Tetrasphaera sp.]
MILAFQVSAAIVAVSALLAVVGVVRSRDDASRAVLADLFYFAAIAGVVLLGVLADSAVVFDVAVIAALIGILGTLALALILTRGRR